MAWVRPGRGLGESKATHWHAVMSEVPDINGKIKSNKNKTKRYKIASTKVRTLCRGRIMRVPLDGTLTTDEKKHGKNLVISDKSLWMHK